MVQLLTFLNNSGRGERIRTSDLSVPNQWFGKNVSFAFSKVAATNDFLWFLHSVTLSRVRYTSRARNSVHKLATGNSRARNVE